MAEKPIRRCRWCKLVLDPHAPTHSEMVATDGHGKRERRVQPHCPSPVCDWCFADYHRRCTLIEQGLNPDTGDPPEIEPNRMS